MHEVVRITPLVERFPLRIGAVCGWGASLLVGTAEGVLLVVGEVPAPPPAPPGETRHEVVATHKHFGRGKGVVQLDAVRDAGVLLALLADGAVAVARLASLAESSGDVAEPVGVLGRCKNASCYRWDPVRGVLAVGCKRKVLLYHWDGRDFAELKEVAVPEAPRCVGWIGDSLLLGFRREYVLVSASTGHTSEVFPTGRAGLPGILAVPGAHGGREEALLQRDNVGVFVGPDGRTTRKHGLPWSEPPLALAAVPPYAVAVLPRLLEVRSTQRGSQHQLVQTLPLKGVKALVPAGSAHPGALYAASDAAVFRLTPVPLADQIAELADRGDFDGALELCALLEHAPSQRRDTESALHTRYAHALFAKGEFQEAMQHFGVSSARATEVLARLLPSLVPPSLPAPPPPPPSSSAPEGWGPPESPALRGARLAEAQAAALPYLLAQHHALQQQLRDAPPPGEEEEEKGARADGRLAAEAVVVDTAALGAMLAARSGKDEVAAFLTEPNSVDHAEAEKMLLGEGRYEEAVELYLSKGLHETALALLSRLGQRPNELSPPPQAPSRFGPAATASYLLRMRPADPALVLAHSAWVLRASPEDGLDVLTGLEPPLPVGDALPHLRDHAPALCAPYLEHEMRARGESLAPEHHNELLLLYLAAVNVERVSGGGWDERGPPSETRRKLLGMLRARPARYSPERMLSRFPVDALFEERALLLSRLDRHRQALTIFAGQLGDLAAAETYCDRVWEEAESTAAPPEGDDPRDVYLDLLSVLLDDQAEGAAPRVEDALALLARRGARVDGERALALLPDSVPLADLLPFLEGALMGGGGSDVARRSLGIIRSLRRAENLEVRGELTELRGRRFLLDNERTCAVCFKRVSNSVFAVHPNGVLVHYSCHTQHLAQQLEDANLALRPAPPHDVMAHASHR